MSTSRSLFGALFGLTLLLAGCGTEFVATTGGGGSATTTTTTTTTHAGGTGGQMSTGGGGAACAPAAGTECDQCQVLNCADSYCGCMESAGCPALAYCLGEAAIAPITDEYYEYCMLTSPGDMALAGSLTACSHDHCPDCAAPEVDPCRACQFASCPDEVNKCATSADCKSYVTCLKGCAGQAGCAGNCQDAHPNGAEEHNAIVECANNACPEACII